MDAPCNTQRLDRRLQKLDGQALLESPIKVRAHPWTDVADDGLVSELVNSFFAWDNSFFCPFIDQECFVEEMNKQDLSETKHCTPLLVNAICASRSVGISLPVAAIILTSDSSRASGRRSSALSQERIWAPCSSIRRRSCSTERVAERPFQRSRHCVSCSTIRDFLEQIERARSTVSWHSRCYDA
jgi:hypothetical protein